MKSPSLRGAAIDDEDDDLDDLPLFQPNTKISLTQDIVDAAVAYLRGESDSRLAAKQDR
jgi:hypothetical protein